MFELCVVALLAFLIYVGATVYVGVILPVVWIGYAICYYIDEKKRVDAFSEEQLVNYIKNHPYGD